MKNRIELEDGGAAPGFAVCIDNMGQSVTSYKEGLEL